MAQFFNEVQYSPEQTRFALFAPEDAKAVKLRLYRDGQGGKALQTVKNDTGNFVPVLIRVDKDVEYRYIDELLAKAVARVGFTKVSIVAIGNE